VSSTLRYRILCDGELIGTSNLEERDESMGVASGLFAPAPAYERVGPVFRMFIEARADGESEPDATKLAAYESARARLELSVTDETGKSLPAAGVAVLDFSGERAGDDAFEVEVYFATPEKFAQLGPVN
jgi:hypothetical protein